MQFQVTILVAAEGAYKLPTVNGSGDLKEALQKIASIPSSKILVSVRNDHQEATSCMLLLAFNLCHLLVAGS